MRRNPRTPVALIALAGMLAMILAALPAAGDPNNEANISCGQPKQAGSVTVKVVLKKKGQADQTVQWTAAGILATDTPEQKAEKIRAAGPGASPYIEAPTRDANTVKTKAKDGWEIKGIGFAADNTNEEEAPNVFAMTTTLVQDGLCSLTGTALQAGSVVVTANRVTVNVPVSVGMTASQIEDAILAGGIPRASLYNGSTMLGGDGRGIRIGQVGTSWSEQGTLPALSIAIDAPGIVLDIGGLTNVTPPVPVADDWGLLALTVLLLAGGAWMMVRRGIAAA
jgi:hypothetical protein